MMEEPGRLRSIGLQSQIWLKRLSTHACNPTVEKREALITLVPRRPCRQRSWRLTDIVRNYPLLAPSECSHKNRFWNAKKRIPTWSFQGRISFNSQLSKHLQASVLYKPCLCPHRWLSIHELSGLWSSFPLSIWLLNSEMRYDLNNFLRTVWLMSFVLLLSLALQGVTPRIGSTSLLILVSPSWQSKTTMGAWSTRWSAFIPCVPRRTAFT